MGMKSMWNPFTQDCFPGHMTMGTIWFNSSHAQGNSTIELLACAGELYDWTLPMRMGTLRLNSSHAHGNTTIELFPCAWEHYDWTLPMRMETLRLNSSHAHGNTTIELFPCEWELYDWNETETVELGKQKRVKMEEIKMITKYIRPTHFAIAHSFTRSLCTPRNSGCITEPN